MHASSLSLSLSLSRQPCGINNDPHHIEKYLKIHAMTKVRAGRMLHIADVKVADVYFIAA